MKKKLLCIALCILAAYMQVYAQGMSVNTTGTPANASAMLDVASTTQGMLVPRMTTTQRTGISLPAKGLLVYDSTLASFYYNSGTPSSPSWTALGGSSLPSGTNGQVLQLVSGSPAWVGNTLTIGASYGGGKIAYILQLGDPGYSALEQHGLIAATSDQSTGIIWGCYGTLEGATGFLLNTGRNNTEIIYQNCGTSGNASAICKSYTGGGYTDWYLPSKDELNKLYINQGAIGGFASAYYWSSSEVYTLGNDCRLVPEFLQWLPDQLPQELPILRACSSGFLIIKLFSYLKRISAKRKNFKKMALYYELPSIRCTYTGPVSFDAATFKAPVTIHEHITGCRYIALAF